MRWVRFLGPVVGMLFLVFLLAKDVWKQAYQQGMMVSACAYIMAEQGANERAMQTIACDAQKKGREHPFHVLLHDNKVEEGE